MKSPHRLLVAVTFLPAFVSAQTLVSDSFADAERATQNLPVSLQWFSTFSSSMSVSAGALKISPTSSTVRGATAYFTMPDAPRELELGERITVSISFTPTVTATTSSANGFRLGIFDSGGHRLTSDANPTDNTYRGYAAFVNPLNSAARIQERIGTGALLTSLGAGIYDSNLATTFGADSLKFQAGESYTASLSVSRSQNNQWLIGFSLSGGNLGNQTFEAEDLTGIVTKFDTISFGLNSDMGATNFTNVSVSVTPIPEPSTTALLGGLVSLVGVWALRRGRREA